MKRGITKLRQDRGDDIGFYFLMVFASTCFGLYILSKLIL